MSPLTPGPSSPPIFVPETQCFERTAKSLSFTAKSIAEIPETVPSEIESEYLSIPQNRFKKKIRHKVSVPNQNCEIPSDNTKKPKSVIPATKNIDQDEHYVAEKLASNKRFLEDEMKRVDQTKKNESKLTIETVVKRKLLNNKCLHRPLSLLVSPNVTDITPVSKKITDRTLQRQEIPKIFGVTTDIRKLEKRPDLKKMIDQIELIPQKKGRKLRSSMFHMQSGSSPINADISRTNSEEDFKVNIVG